MAQVEQRGAGAWLVAAGQRVALVIGNADYVSGIGQLANPVNDAGDVANGLASIWSAVRRI